MSDMEHEEIEKMMRDYRLTTAEILYHLPDYPKLLQTFVWQELDLAPKFPQLHKFIDFWNRELDGKIHSVKVAHTDLIMPSNVQFIRGLNTVH
jgi:uncharacterized protein Usg